MKLEVENKIKLFHGSGGSLTNKLISDIFHKNFSNEILLQTGDSALISINSEKLAFTTDSYVITPRFFKGGNIGKLAICGTVNDLAVSGAIPKYLSCGFIIEEGFLINELEEIVKEMSIAAAEAGVIIVTGDTKVVPNGCADGLFINTSGIGSIIENLNITPLRICEGDSVIITGTVGDHGTAIMLERENFNIEAQIKSDCAPLNKMLQRVCIEVKDAVHVMRDPTRGGLAATLNELSKQGKTGIMLYEDKIPITPSVEGVCEMLGLEPIYMANEGKAILIVASDSANRVIEILKEFEYGREACIIGEITNKYGERVFMETITGGSRVIDMPVGDPLPRIC
jgi:hydrogenase expression/formation protein HypE